jgi:hypothetical protein
MRVPGRPSGLLRHRRVKMQSLAVSTALQCGRGDRAPPRKPPLAPSAGMSPPGDPTLANPRGGAGSARPRGNALASPWYAPARPPASRLLLARHALSRACVRPCHPGAETAPLRENHLSRHLLPLPRKALTRWLSHPLGPVSTTLPSAPPGPPKPPPPPCQKNFSPSPP